MGAVGCQHSLHFAPEVATRSVVERKGQIILCRLPVGRQLAGPFVSQSSQVSCDVTQRPFIHYLAVPSEGCWPRRTAIHPDNQSSDNGRDLWREKRQRLEGSAVVLFVHVHAPGRRGLRPAENHESPGGRREAMRPIWAHGWKRRQTRVMQWSRGGGGLGDASVFVQAEMGKWLT